jgi:hypothetical protein
MLRHTKASDIGASRAGQCRVGHDQNARLPWVWLERITTERFTRALDQVAVEVRQSAAKCRRTDSVGWRPRPSGTRHSAHGLTTFAPMSSARNGSVGKHGPFTGGCFVLLGWRISPAHVLMRPQRLGMSWSLSSKAPSSGSPPSSGDLSGSILMLSLPPSSIAARRKVSSACLTSFWRFHSAA